MSLIDIIDIIVIMKHILLRLHRSFLHSLFIRSRPPPAILLLILFLILAL